MKEVPFLWKVYKNPYLFFQKGKDWRLSTYTRLTSIFRSHVSDKEILALTPAEISGLVVGVILAALIAICLIACCYKEIKKQIKKRGLVSG